ncbi:hypothetical protein HCR18_06130 [Wolbachia pipientis]|nr:hypothetical protein [Wolbachia pipientis]MBA8758573.1 hypothetical protein [Wolbachia pipientis]MBA8770415.1 hypothetical protein [Wolbachia pipientis]
MPKHNWSYMQNRSQCQATWMTKKEHWNTSQGHWNDTIFGLLNCFSHKH